MALLLPLQAYAQQVRPPIHVDASHKDVVGRRLGLEFQTQLSQSPFFTMTDLESKAVFRLKLVTISNGKEDYVSTVYALTITAMDPKNVEGPSYFMNSIVGFCGADRVRDCATDILAAVVSERNSLMGN